MWNLIRATLTCYSSNPETRGLRDFPAPEGFSVSSAVSVCCSAQVQALCPPEGDTGTLRPDVLVLKWVIMWEEAEKFPL